MQSDGKPLPPELKGFASAVKRALKRAQRKSGKLDEDLRASRHADELQRHGELLKANLDSIPRGAKEATVRNWYDTADPDATVTIPLNPARPARETMRKLFRSATKLERGRPRIEAQIVQNNDRIKELETLLRDFDTWHWNATEEELAALPAELADRARELRAITDNTSRAATHEPKRSAKEERLAKLMRSVRVFRSYDGMDILVGKTARDNDTLTFQIARGNDWWFHLSAAPGSHVVVRNDGRDSLPQETLLDAATLAVHFSKMRDAPRADVTHTRPKFVRRIRGAPAGKVQLMRSDTLMLRLEPDRLERLTHQ